MFTGILAVSFTHLFFPTWLTPERIQLLPVQTHCQPFRPGNICAPDFPPGWSQTEADFFLLLMLFPHSPSKPSEEESQLHEIQPKTHILLMHPLPLCQIEWLSSSEMPHPEDQVPQL